MFGPARFLIPDIDSMCITFWATSTISRFSCGFGEICTASFRSCPAFPVRTLNSCWPSYFRQKKHRVLSRGCVDDRKNGAGPEIDGLLLSVSMLLFLRPLSFWGVWPSRQEALLAVSCTLPLDCVRGIQVACTMPDCILSLQCFYCAVFKPFLYFNKLTIIWHDPLFYCL